LELVGRCLWDIFSDNHEVLGPDGRIVDIGSFRGAGSFLAELANVQIGHERGAAEKRDMARFERLAALGSDVSVEKIMAMVSEGESPDRPYDYMDFYMGTQTVAHRADLTPVYQMIFRRLQAADCDWRYTFPRLHLVSFRREDLPAGSRDEPDWAEYDPSAALADQQQDRERREEIEKMRADLDESYRESVDQAREGPPPITVSAYNQIYGELPQGWPPQIEE